MEDISDILDDSSEGKDEIIAFLKSNTQRKKIKKGTVLQYQGELSTKGFFVAKGLLRSYTVDAKGREHIFIFAPEGWYISDIASYTTNTESELFIDAIEDSEIEIIDRNLINMGKIPPQLLQANTDKLMKRISVLQKRVILLMSATAKERYQHFLETYPQIVNRVPQKMIASYLGITPEALSNTKRKLFKGE